MHKLIPLLLLFISCVHHTPPIQPEQFYPARDKVNLSFKNSFWQKSNFDYSGQVEYSDSSVILHRGGYLTGITWLGPLLFDNYKVELDARRIEGMDFFCGLTFPVGDESCSLILGGWGGFTTGLSSINGSDAANNETMNSYIFANQTWYHISLWVSTNQISATVNNYEIFDLERTGKTFSIRYEVEESVPLGISTFNTTGEIRNITIERL